MRARQNGPDSEARIFCEHFANIYRPSDSCTLLLSKILRSNVARDFCADGFAVVCVCVCNHSRNLLPVCKRRLFSRLTPKNASDRFSRMPRTNNDKCVCSRFADTTRRRAYIVRPAHTMHLQPQRRPRAGNANIDAVCARHANCIWSTCIAYTYIRYAHCVVVHYC